VHHRTLRRNGTLSNFALSQTPVPLNVETLH
jgi:hypothetical protein